MKMKMKTAETAEKQKHALRICQAEHKNRKQTSGQAAGLRRGAVA